MKNCLDIQVVFFLKVQENYCKKYFCSKKLPKKMYNFFFVTESSVKKFTKNLRHFENCKKNLKNVIHQNFVRK